jgi:excisionase family DNA binding protein
MSTYTTRQAADYLAVSEQRVRQLIKAGTLKAAKFGGAHLIHARDLEKVVVYGKSGRPRRAPVGGTRTP